MFDIHLQVFDVESPICVMIVLIPKTLPPRSSGSPPTFPLLPPLPSRSSLSCIPRARAAAPSCPTLPPSWSSVSPSLGPCTFVQSPSTPASPPCSHVVSACLPSALHLTSFALLSRNLRTLSTRIPQSAHAPCFSDLRPSRRYPVVPSARRTRRKPIVVLPPHFP